MPRQGRVLAVDEPHHITHRGHNRHDIFLTDEDQRRYEGEESIDFKYRPLAAGDCQKCHYGEFSRPFYWHEFWPSIKHGSEPQRAAAAATAK